MPLKKINMAKKITVTLSSKAEKYFNEVMYALPGKDGEGCCTQSEAINESLETLADFEKATDNQLRNWNSDFAKLEDNDKKFAADPVDKNLPYTKS